MLVHSGFMLLFAFGIWFLELYMSGLEMDF
jgi:hypothetical protein